MDFKKWFSCFIAMGIFVLWGGLMPAQADEAALINLLKKKNIITQQEADELMKELQTSAQKEKTDIKKEVKAEVKEDIKKSADKGEFLPQALKGVSFNAQIFAEWNGVNRFDGYAPTSTTAPSKNSNAFALNRGQLSFTKEFNDWLGMNITTDLFYSTDVNDSTQGAELRLKTAYGYVKYGNTVTMAGMVNTPSDGYDLSIWPYRVQGKNLLDDLGILATYDLGIANQGVFGGYMDDEYLKFGQKSFSGKWGGYMVGLYNGAGYTTSTGEGNNNKLVSALIYFRPLPTTRVLKGLQLAYFGAYGQSNKLGTLPGQTNTYPDFQINMGQISLLHQNFAVNAQYYWGRGTATGTEDKDRTGYLLEGFVRMPIVDKLRAFGKIYNYDPDTNIQKNDYNIYVAGLSYDVTPEFMPFVAWERRDNHVNVAPGTTSANIDYNKYQVGMQIKF
ncbi:MAG: hypothetical protein CSYNP_03279 [Syntrophus sp. SKADARSKE-3]|nr:hypothetical protein [Syntrophus sp. SKADARSKE-3]